MNAIHRPNRAQRILDHLLDREGIPVDTFTLERLAGRRSWRTAVSEARQLARLLRRDIVNHQRRKVIGKRRWTDSTYVLVKVSRKKAA